MLGRLEWRDRSSGATAQHRCGTKKTETPARGDRAGVSKERVSSGDAGSYFFSSLIIALISAISCLRQKIS